MRRPQAPVWNVNFARMLLLPSTPAARAFNLETPAWLLKDKQEQQQV